MSSLANQQQNLSFPGLLQVPGGITSALQQVQDGNGNATGLSLSSTGAYSLGQVISVTDFGAVGDGVTDDSTAIQDGINYLSSIDGGYLSFPPGVFVITTTLTIDDDNINLVGSGSGMFFGDIDAATLASASTTIKYTGVTAIPVIHFTCQPGGYSKHGGGMSDILVNANSVASYGILVSSRKRLTVRNVNIFDTATANVQFQGYSGVLYSPTAGYDVQHCLLENVTASLKTSNTTSHGFVLTGGNGNGNLGTGNSSFNTFINCRPFAAATKASVFLQNTDNNAFYALRANGGGSPYGAIYFGCAEDDASGGGAVSRYTNIFGCEAVAGVIAKASQVGNASSHSNNIFGYNISNGGGAPTIETGAGGSADASLTLYATAYQYAATDIKLPENGTLNFTNASNSIVDSRTVLYSKLFLYEQGNLAPGTVTVEGGTTAGTGTYSVATGSYSRIGNICKFNLLVTYTGHTGTGDLIINGLPFTNVNTNRLQPLSIMTSNLTFTGQISAVPIQNTKQINIKVSASSTAIATLQMGAAASIYINGEYTIE